MLAVEKFFTGQLPFTGTVPETGIKDQRPSCQQFGGG